MGLTLGSTDVADVKLGASQVDAVYVGSEKVWPIITNPVFVGSASDSDASGPWSIDVSGIGIQAGDLVMMLLTSDSLSVAGTFTPDFTRLEAPYNGCQSDLRYHVATGPITTISNGGSTDRAGTTIIICVYRNAGVPTNWANSQSSGNSTNPNPPQLTGIAPTSIVCAMASMDDESINMGAPAGYTLREANNYDPGGFGDKSSAAWADLPTAPNATEDPGPFDSLGASDEWIAWTLEIPVG